MKLNLPEVILKSDLQENKKYIMSFIPLGDMKWPSGVFLKFTSGDQLGPVNMVNVKPLQPGESADVSVNMISPGKTGIFQGQWRLCTPTGQYFGGENLEKNTLYLDGGGLMAYNYCTQNTAT